MMTKTLRQSALFIMAAALLSLEHSCTTPEKLERRGDKYYAIGEYYEAAAQYKRAYSATPAKQRDLRGKRAFLMAESFRHIAYTARAVGAYQNAARYKYIDTTTYFWLGEMQRAQGNYREAAKSYSEYLDLNREEFHSLAQKGIEACAVAPLLKQRGSDYTVKLDKKFNSRRADYCPAIYGDNHDRIVFASTRPQATGEDDSGITGTKAGDLFGSKKDEKGNWLQPEPLQGSINTAFDEGAPCITPDGQTMFFTVCRTDPQYPRYAEIWQSSRSDASWSSPQKCEISKDTLSSFAHPAVSPDGKWLYFSSDMPGGQGGFDIWRVSIEQGGFGPIQNVGTPVNTEGDEKFPTFRPNGDLYYSSTGNVGLGGLDIFKAKVDSIAGTTKIEHLPCPVNSEGDDFGMTFDGVYNRGFFSSNRGNGRGWDNIYTFECPEIVQSVRGWVYEQDGYELTKAVVYMVGDDGTNLKLGVKLDGSFEQTVNPGVHYVFLATCDGFLNYAQELAVDSVRQSTVHTLQFPLASVSQPVLVRNVFYDLDKATLTPDSRTALYGLTSLLNQNPNVTIELSAHCDYRASDSYNMRLSQRRAESVVRYLISHGINPKRLKAVGYGERRPKIVSRRMAETYKFLHVGDTLTEKYIKKLTPAQQDTCNALNRRTEFQVLRTTFGLFDGNNKATHTDSIKKRTLSADSMAAPILDDIPANRAQGNEDIELTPAENPAMPASEEKEIEFLPAPTAEGRK